MWPAAPSAHDMERINALDTHITVAIDGPSGAGKSTIARAAARRFGLIYVDTGAIYRTVGLAGERAGVNCSDAAAMQALLPALRIELVYDAAGEQRMLLNGEDVSDTIRLPEVSLLASRVSALPVVRAFLLDMQRSLARTHSVVMDARHRHGRFAGCRAEDLSVRLCGVPRAAPLASVAGKGHSGAVCRRAARARAARL